MSSDEKTLEKDDIDGTRSKALAGVEALGVQLRAQ